MAVRHWADICTSDFANADLSGAVAVMPTAATEQHGPHLPLGTDTMIAEGMLAELMRRGADSEDVLILPVQSVGKSDEHIRSAGTLTLSAETALSVWTEIGLSVARAGVRRLIVINSHGGNFDLLSVLVRRLRSEAGMLAVRCQWGAFGYPEGLYSDQEMTHGLHGGDVETSLMLAFRPETVRMDHAQDFRSAAETSLVPPVGPVAAGWIAGDLNPHGVTGEAHLATAEKGHATARHQVDGFLELVAKVAMSPLPDL